MMAAWYVLAGKHRRARRGGDPTPWVRVIRPVPPPRHGYRYLRLWYRVIRRFGSAQRRKPGSTSHRAKPSRTNSWRLEATQ
jgi:hypothetical protein